MQRRGELVVDLTAHSIQHEFNIHAPCRGRGGEAHRQESVVALTNMPAGGLLIFVPLLAQNSKPVWPPLSAAFKRFKTPPACVSPHRGCGTHHNHHHSLAFFSLQSCGSSLAVKMWG